MSTFTLRLQQAKVRLGCLKNVTVISSAPPCKPRNFVVRETTSRTVTLQWIAPESDGGSVVTSKLWFILQNEAQHSFTLFEFVCTRYF